MSRGVWVGGLVLALFAAFPPAHVRAAAPAEKKAEDPAVEKVLEELRKPKLDYEEIEKPLDELLQKAREHDADTSGLPPDTASEDELKTLMDRAVRDGRYDLAAYYLERIKQLNAKPDIFRPALDLTIWTIVVFLMLAVILGAFAWKPMLQGLEKREHDIKAAVHDARTAREEAQKLREEVQADRVKTEDMRREIIQKAQSDAQRTADEIMAKAKADVHAERERLRRDMDTARDQAVQELWKQTADIAAMVSTKVMRRMMTADDHRRFVDEALVDIKQAGTGRKTTASV